MVAAAMELCTASSLGFETAHNCWVNLKPKRNEECRPPSSRIEPACTAAARKASTVVDCGLFRSVHMRFRPKDPVVRSDSLGLGRCQSPADDQSGFARVSAVWNLQPAGRRRIASSCKQGVERLLSLARPGIGEPYSTTWFLNPPQSLHLQSQCQIRKILMSPKVRKRFQRWIIVCQARAADVALHSHDIHSSKRTSSSGVHCQLQSSELHTNLGNCLSPHVSAFSIYGSNPASFTRAKRWKLRVGVGEDLPPDYQDDDPLKKVPQRRCGILLHPSSLPGAYGIGELGKEAFIFLDWLKATGCTVWQVLPLVPPGRKGGEDGSPYAGNDANCGNTLLISLDELVKDGLLEKADLPKTIPVKRMNYAAVEATKDPLVTKAAKKLVGSTGKLRDELEKFRKCPRISAWLEEAALFAAIDQSINAKFWWTWPPLLRDRDSAALDAARHKHKDFIDHFIAAQFLFQRQWQAIHKYANAAGIRIVGDMPIYVGGHSADVWAHRSLFALDPKTGAPVTVSGVPPDAFSATGQLWGSPLYNWKEMAKDGYSWWATRLKRAFELYDEFRIDHFRGLAGYWAIPATAETAMSGKWKAGPGTAFFKAIKEAVGKVDIIAEDLGVITGDVVALRQAVNAPGMAVLQFAFGNDARNPHLPHNHEVEQVVYPGTHDNDTCVGWWKKASAKEKESAKSYLRFHKEEEVHWEFIRGSVASVARTTIIPMQDVMGLDNNARMNIPATQAGNWGWRVGETGTFQKLDKEKLRLHALLSDFNRLPRSAPAAAAASASPPSILHS